MTGADLITDRVDSTCDEFETLWNSGTTPRVEQFLPPRSDPEFQTMLAELLGLELDFRRARGEAPAFDEYAARFPADLLILAGFELGPIRVESADEGSPPPCVAGFQLEEHLGAGTFGTVWRARDLQLQRTVALKLPRVGRFAPEEDLQHFLREAQAAARLNHPNIVRLHSAGMDDGRVFLAIEYVEGPNLREWLALNWPEPVVAARLCASIADGLAHAHRHDVIHRDLKPANLLIDREGEPHITDFGLAKRLSAAESTVSGMHVLGTPAYMSPEQAEGNSRHVDARTDIYSVGVILYELLTGRVPFEGDHAGILRGMLEGKPIPPRQLRPDISADLEAVCLKAMARDREARYGTAAELAADLRRVIEGEPVLTRRPARSPKTRLLTRRQFASLALATAPVLGYAMWAGTPRREGRHIRITTDPVGAELWFIPLDPATEEPQPERIIYCGRSPVDTYLPPGDYLVEAVLDSERFQESIRCVPDPRVTIPFAHSHRSSRIHPDKSVDLPRIAIRTPSNFNQLAHIAGSPHFEMGVPGSTVAPRHARSVPPFLMSPVEFTFGNYRAFNGGRLTPPRVEAEHPDDVAMDLNFDGAVAMAERSGGRLPHEAEYEFVATLGGASPLGAVVDGPSSGAGRFGPVGEGNDRIDLDPRVPIFGLCSNVAEWMINRAGVYPGGKAEQGAPIDEIGDFRIVRGGRFRTDENGRPVLVEAPCDPRARETMFRYRNFQGLGFRFVRSPAPRLRPEDFVRVIASEPADSPV